jgi:hypothetical protein
VSRTRSSLIVSVLNNSYSAKMKILYDQHGQDVLRMGVKDRDNSKLLDIIDVYRVSRWLHVPVELL